MSDEQPNIPAPHRLGCTSYANGHNVHFVQPIHSARPEAAALSWPGELVALDGELLTVRADGGDVVLYRNHDPVRLAAVVDAVGSGVLVNDRYAIVRIGSYCFSILTDSGTLLDPCPTDDVPSDASLDELVDRLKTHGGFVVSLDALR